MAKAFVLHEPVGQSVPVVFDSPHGGAEYPEDFGCVVPLNALRGTEDAFVDEDGVEKNSGFARLQDDITLLIAAIRDHARNTAI